MVGGGRMVGKRELYNVGGQGRLAYLRKRLGKDRDEEVGEDAPEEG